MVNTLHNGSSSLYCQKLSFLLQNDDRRALRNIINKDTQKLCENNIRNSPQSSFAFAVHKSNIGQEYSFCLGFELMEYLHNSFSKSPNSMNTRTYTKIKLCTKLKDAKYIHTNQASES